MADDPAKPMAKRVLRAMLEVKFSARDWLRQFQGREMPASAQLVLLAAAPAGEGANGAQGADLVRALVSDPVYQLK
jgi:hypothetical protein